MKVPLLVSALAAAIAPMSQAAVVTVNQNIHTFLTSPSNSGHTRDVLFNDGAGNTVTLQFTVTTASGEAFKSLDSAQRVGVGNGAPDWNVIDNTEDVTFAVKYSSHTGTVDLSSIAFRFDSIGFRNFNSVAHNINWTVNGGSTLTQVAAAVSEIDYALDASFTTIGSGAGNYSGVFENQNSSVTDAGQLTRNTPTTGLKFSVQFVPEPSSALLGSLGVLALLRRRRQ